MSSNKPADISSSHSITPADGAQISNPSNAEPNSDSTKCTHPLWHHDIDEFSLAIEQTRNLLQNWMPKINRNKITAPLTGQPNIDYYGRTWKEWHHQVQKMHAGGPRATSSEERDS